MGDLKKYSTNKYLSNSERGFLKNVYNFAQKAGFTTVKQDQAAGRVISRARSGATDRAKIKRRRATGEIRQRERDAEEGKQEENNEAKAFNREVAGALGNTGEA